ncbi:mediator of RNA polymerase II transcription subunit 1 [Lampris incognitus]|uniref:mediator of RNA polymerase II transcription subunit 1 n=1 Tax=Lampris incognitus TaxID=2546036 RepID=UPI0024B5EC82|nr:mediator of RNA polymerase II transcription subunit 1 [Lampris incognitus]
MRARSIITDLHRKFAETTWNDTFQLVRRCMDMPRKNSNQCEQLVRCLERLQGALNVSSMKATMSRLEIMAKQKGMGFHFTEATCYLTADLFYLEIVLLPEGGVKEVTVAPHIAAPVSSESLLLLLRSNNFLEFSSKLAHLSAVYNLPGDNETKAKLLASIQYLGTDLQKMSNLPRKLKDRDPHVDTILNGLTGYLKAGKDCLLTIQFYVNPSGVRKTTDSGMEKVNTAQVIMGCTDETHKLQMASLIPKPPQLDPKGHPVFSPLREMPHETLPFCFLLRLDPPLPMFYSFVNKLGQITDITIPDVVLQRTPFPKLLMNNSSSSAKQCEDTFDELDTVSIVTLPAEKKHSYVLPEAAWELPALCGTMVDSIPFTHPAHVPPVLEVLRHQCAVNTLLTTCLTSQWESLDELHFCDADSYWKNLLIRSVNDRPYEVLPESDTSFSVTFLRPDIDSLAVLLVNVFGCRQLTCRLFAAGIMDPSMDEHITKVMKRCMSIPVTMRELYCKLEKMVMLPPPVGSATVEGEDDVQLPPLTRQQPVTLPLSQSNSDAAPPLTTVYQDAVGPEHNSTCSVPYVMSVATSGFVPEINTILPANPLPHATVDSHCVTNNSQLTELIQL